MFLESLVKHCRTEAGFAAIEDVRTMEKADSMESFLFAETLKYLHLLFAPDSAFDPRRPCPHDGGPPARRPCASTQRSTFSVRSGTVKWPL